MLHRFIFFTFFIFDGMTSTHAEEIYLKNGDRISGKIIKETAIEIIIETQAMGIISVAKGFIEQEEVEREVAGKDSGVKWERKISLGV